MDPNGGISDVNEAFRFLRPITVPVTQNHDVESVTKLHEVLANGTLSDDVLQEMHEYIAFPLRLVLKQYGHKEEKLAIATLQCLTVLLSKSNVKKINVCTDLMENLLKYINPAPQVGKHVSEEMRYEAVEALSNLFKRCDPECYSIQIVAVLPLVGSLIQGLLEIAAKQRLRKLQISSLNLLIIMIDTRNDKKLTKLLERMMPTYLPGVTTQLVKICTVTNQKARILQLSLRIMWTVVMLTFRKSAFPDYPEPVIMTDGYEKLKHLFLVAKDEKWYSDAKENLQAVVKGLGTKFIFHESWQVRRELTEWAYHMLIHCDEVIPDSRGYLLDYIVRNLEDTYPQVSAASQKRLKELNKTRDKVSKVLNNRLYVHASKLPRILHKNDQTVSLQTLRLFTGYLNALSDQIAHVLSCQIHLQRITVALCTILQLDCTSVKILETAKSDHQLTASNVVFPVLRRQYTLFTDVLIWKEIQSCITYFVNNSDLYPLVENFMSEFQDNLIHRVPCAIILNEILGAHVELADDPEKEVIDSCTSVLELYCDTYRQIIRSDSHNTSQQLDIKQRNSQIQLQCILLEGLTIIHQVTGGSYPELLLHSLYSMLESCAHDNIIIKQTAVTGLSVISSAFSYSGTAELIEKHCNYLCNTLSLNIRQLHRYPTCPQVLCSVLQYSASTILPYIEQIIIELLYSLDEHYIDDALSLLRVPQILLRQLCVWYPLTTEVNVMSPKGQAQEAIKKAAGSQNICDYVREYYETRLVAESSDVSDIPDDGSAYHSAVEDLESEEESTMSKKQIPLHIKLAKKVLERCHHLISHPSTKVRLITIDMIADGCKVLNTVQDELLPAIHDVWTGFSKRFDDPEPLVVLKAINTLGILGDLSKDFIRGRVSKEVLPALIAFLIKKTDVSGKAGKGYTHTLDYRLQLKCIQTISQLSVDLKLVYVTLEKVIEASIQYLSAKQPKQLQEAAVEGIKVLSDYDSDLVWYHINALVSGNKQTGCRLYEDNAETLMEHIGVQVQ